MVRNSGLKYFMQFTSIFCFPLNLKLNLKFCTQIATTSLEMYNSEYIKMHAYIHIYIHTHILYDIKVYFTLPQMLVSTLSNSQPRLKDSRIMKLHIKTYLSGSKK